MRICVWTRDCDIDAWDTECQNLFQFTVDGPVENKFVFCPYCGGKILVKIDEERE